MKHLKTTILTLIATFILTSCNNIQSNTRTKLTLQPNEEYLINNVEEVNNKTLQLRKDAPNEVDYAFSISKTETDELNLINPNDLIIGRDRVLLQPVAVNYLVEDGVVTDNEESRLTIEQTESNFTPIIEMSGSGYGNENITLDLYDTPQLRTCYAISNSEGILQSEYYDISIIIEDSIAPTSISDVLNLSPYISYKNSNSNDVSVLNENILRNYTDNDTNTTLSVKYYQDDTYQDEISGEDVISNLRNSSILIQNNKLTSQPVYFKVFDDNNNGSNNGLAYVTLYDDVKPYIVNLNNEEVTSFNFGTRDYYPDVNNDVKDYIINNFKVIDEVDGQLDISKAEINITNQGLSLKISDNSYNELNILDPESKLNNNFTQDSYYVWYPEGASQDINPERGLQYHFILNETSNEYEIEILGPNLGQGQYKKDWLGTNGQGHIQIPQTITLYDHEYKVTSIGEDAFHNVNVISLDTTNIGQTDVIDFSNTYISHFSIRSINDGSGYNYSKIILDTLSNGVVLEDLAISFNCEDTILFLSKKVSKIDYHGCIIHNLYLEFSQEELKEKEESGDFYMDYNENGELMDAWYGAYHSLYEMYYNYTLDQFKTEFGIN